MKPLRKIGLYGVGTSNLGVAHKLCRAFPGLKIVIRSDREPEDLTALPKGAQIGLFTGKRAAESIDEDILFLSPSVRPDRKEFADAAARGVLVSSDAKLFFEGAEKFGISPFRGEVLAVTGSDGKSSVTALAAGMTGGIACGNFGKSFADVPDGALAVAELSSFQLQDLTPPVRRAVITNITENHLNWHKNFDEYRAAKARLFSGAREKILSLHAAGIDSLLFGSELFCLCSTRGEDTPPKGMTVRHFLSLKGDLVFLDGEEFASLRGARLTADYAKEDYLFAIALSLGYSDRERIERTVGDFSGLAHRAQFCGRIGQVGFYDSSIDSTPERTRHTLSAARGKPVVILGGRGKGLSFAPLTKILAEKASAAVLLGENSEELRGAVGDLPGITVGTMKEAVAAAYRMADGREDVLLSPAATSFDRYRNFAERGDDFQAEVRALIRAEDGVKPEYP